MNIFKLDLYFLQTVENSTTESIYCNGISDYHDDKWLYLANRDTEHRLNLNSVETACFLSCFSSHLSSLLSLYAFFPSQLNRDGAFLNGNHNPDF